MNKAELVEFIAGDMETSKAEAERFVKSFTAAVTRNLRKDGVKIAGFGTFGAKKRKAKTGRNPQTGEEMKIPSKWVPFFKAGTSLKDAASKTK